MPKAAATMSAEPNVTPMIDVLLVLLIIFMVATSGARKTIDAQLPPDHATPGDPAASIVLEVGAGAHYAVNRQPVASSNLTAYLRSLYFGRPDKTIVVRGAGDASYQEVISAMDAASGAGVKVIGIDTHPK